MRWIVHAAYNRYFTSRTRSRACNFHRQQPVLQQARFSRDQQTPADMTFNLLLYHLLLRKVLLLFRVGGPLCDGARRIFGPGANGIQRESLEEVQVPPLT